MRQTNRTRSPADVLCDELKDLLQREVVAAQDVTLAGGASLQGREVAGRDVVDVHEVQSRIDERRHSTRGGIEQIRQLVRISGEFGRPIATAQQAREIMKIGVFYETADETLRANGFAPNRNGGNQGFLRKPD